MTGLCPSCPFIVPASLFGWLFQRLIFVMLLIWTAWLYYCMNSASFYVCKFDFNDSFTDAYNDCSKTIYTPTVKYLKNMESFKATQTFWDCGKDVKWNSLILGHLILTPRRIWTGAWMLLLPAMNEKRKGNTISETAVGAVCCRIALVPYYKEHYRIG